MKNDFLWLIIEAFDKGFFKKIVFSRPDGGEFPKISGRAAMGAKEKLLVLEYTHPSKTVSQKNLTFDALEENLRPLIEGFAQVNLLTTLGDAEYKRKNNGAEVLLGADKLKRKLSSSEGTAPLAAVENLDRKKNYLIDGTEPYMALLGISDKNGRVHDKMQGKFRQIHRFLENLQVIYADLPAEGVLTVYDLCCGKSYLSFAVYHYLTTVLGREVDMLCVDLKADMMDYCQKTAEALGFRGMRFLCEDIRKLPKEGDVHLVISLHACDVATDIVLQTATALSAKAILSTPCCQKYLSERIRNDSLSFVTEYGHLNRKLSDALTDALRALYLKKEGYRVQVCELTDPQDTPKNTLLRAVKVRKSHEDAQKQYDAALAFLLGDGAKDYLKEFE